MVISLKKLIKKIIKLNKKRKGFTLVEILITIALIGLLFGIGIPGVMKISNNMKKRSFETKTNLVEQAGTLYGEDNKTLLQSNECIIDGKKIPCKRISVKELIEEDYLDSEKNNELKFVNPMDNNDLLDSCVFIYRKNNRIYTYFEYKEGNCQVLSPPKFSTSLSPLSNDLYKNEFKLTIKNNNYKREGQKYVIEYTINGVSKSTENTEENILIKDRTVITNAKVCILGTTNCSKNAEDFSASLKLGEILLYTSYIDETNNIPFVTGNWYNDESLDIIIKSKYSKEILYKTTGLNDTSPTGEDGFEQYPDKKSFTEATRLAVKVIGQSNGEYVQENSVDYYILIDKIKPTINISKGLSSDKSKIKITFNLSDDLSGLKDYKIVTNETYCSNNSAWIAISSSFSKEYTSSGTYYICVKDKAGNVQSKSYSVPGIIGNISLSSGSGTWHNSNFNISATSSNATKIEFIKNNSIVHSCTSSTCTYNVTNETGGETITIKSYGEYNQEKTASYVVKLDKTKPTVNITTGLSTDKTKIKMTFNLSDNLSGIKLYKVVSNSNDCNNTSGWSNASSQITKEYTSSGSYYICVKDNVENIQSKNYSVPAMIGNVTIAASDGIGSGSWHKSNFNITATSTNATNIQFVKNGTVVQTCSSSSCTYNVTNETSGETISVKAYRKYGNDTKEKTASYVVRLDKNNPTISETGTSELSNGIQKSFKLSDTMSVLNSYKVTKGTNCNDSTAWNNISGREYSFSYLFTTGGTYSVCAKDASGRVSSKSFEIKILGDIIFTTSDGISSGNWHKDKFTLTISSAYSDKIWYSYDNSRWRNDISFANSKATKDFDTSTNSTSYVYFKAFLGDMFKTAGYSVKIDRVKPQISSDGYTDYIHKRIRKYELEESSKGSGLNGYKISRRSDCNDNVSWTSLSGRIANISLTFEEKGTYYLCVRDVAGNINTEKIEINNVIKDFSYQYHCCGPNDYCNNLADTASTLYDCANNRLTSDLKVIIRTGTPLNDKSYVVDYGTPRNFYAFNLLQQDGKYQYTIDLKSKEYKTGYNYYNVKYNLCNDDGCTGEIIDRIEGNTFIGPSIYN